MLLGDDADILGAINTSFDRIWSLRAACVDKFRNAVNDNVARQGQPPSAIGLQRHRGTEARQPRV